MPYPRFLKLREAKRVHFLDIAAQEFAAHGYAGASLNRILERASMSKGATYYYFADKADVFATVVQYASEELDLIDQEVAIESLDVDAFWLTFEDVHRVPLLRSFDRPWLFGTLKAAERLPPELLAREPLASFTRGIVAYTMAFLARGQALNLVRTDLPDVLLFAWIQGLDRAGDDWLLAHWGELDRDTIARISDETVAAMRQVLLPGGH